MSCTPGMSCCCFRCLSLRLLTVVVLAYTGGLESIKMGGDDDDIRWSWSTTDCPSSPSTPSRPGCLPVRFFMLARLLMDAFAIQPAEFYHVDHFPGQGLIGDLPWPQCVTPWHRFQLRWRLHHGGRYPQRRFIVDCGPWDEQSTWDPMWHGPAQWQGSQHHELRDIAPDAMSLSMVVTGCWRVHCPSFCNAMTVYYVLFWTLGHPWGARGWACLVLLPRSPPSCSATIPLWCGFTVKFKRSALFEHVQEDGPTSVRHRNHKGGVELWSLRWPQPPWGKFCGLYSGPELSELA